MRTLLLTAIFSVTLISIASLQSIDDPRIELHLLKVENAKLRSMVAQLQAELDTVRLTAERTTLVEQLRKELHPPEGAIFDWNSRTFVVPKEVK